MNVKGNHHTETYTDAQIITQLLERSVPKNEAEKAHLLEGAARIMKSLYKIKNWDKVKGKLTAKQLLFIVEDE